MQPRSLIRPRAPVSARRTPWILARASRALVLALAAWPGAGAAAADALCARVKIEIAQEATLERQAFDAHLRISNGLTDAALEQVGVEVTFADAGGAPVLASSDPNAAGARFFFRIDRLENIDDATGQGTVAPATTADIHWLIVPAPDASNGLEQGALYFVGATLRYRLGGREQVTVVSPDYIFVKPMPELTLDYFLPKDVYGDDAFTLAVEPPVPFSLGVRASNAGSGTARAFRIDSAQPRIVENEQGLLIGFVIEGVEVNGATAGAGLSAALGDIAPNTAALARWVMTCTLSGRFVEFSAEFAHADEFGGELTSLIRDVRTHTLVRDVLVDLPGRDAVRDFLARDGDALRVYESSGLDTDVSDLSAQATLTLTRTGGPRDAGAPSSTRGHHPGAPASRRPKGRPDRQTLQADAVRGVSRRSAYPRTTPAEAGEELPNGSRYSDPEPSRGVTATLAFPPTAGPAYGKLPDPFAGARIVTGAVRADGKRLAPANVWLSATRRADQTWEHFVNLFDVNTPGAYTLTFDELAAVPQPPVVMFIPDRTRFEGEQLSFLVSASDPNGTVPVLTAGALPIGAAFADRGDGTGVFDWTPAPGQAGQYTVAFTASDGALSATRHGRLAILANELFTLSLPGTGAPELHFGLRAGASAGFDEGLDETLAAPPRDVVAYFANRDAADPERARLRADYRAAEDPARWRLVLERPRDAAPLVLAWTLGARRADRSMLLQPLDGETPVGAPLDMGAVGQTEIGATQTWEICYGTPTSTTLAVAAGWNLIGAPLMSVLPAGQLLTEGRQPARLGPLWFWHGRYEPLDPALPLNPERGYWAWAGAAGASASLTGLPADGRVTLAAGWNLISPAYDTLVPDDPAIVGGVWTWNASARAYRAVFPAERLVPGTGYWVFCAEPGVLDLPAAPEP